jgi:hypothetical protein
MSGADDGRVRWSLAPAAIPLVLHECGDLVLLNTGLDGFHRGKVRGHGRTDGFTEEGDLASVFDGALGGDHRPHVLKVDHGRAVFQKYHCLAAGRRIAVCRNVGINDWTAAGQQFGDFFRKLAHLFHVVETCEFWSVRIVRTQLWPGELLEAHIARRQKENLSVDAGRSLALCLGCRRNEQSGSRHSNTGEVIEVLILAKAKDRVHALEGRGEHNDSTGLFCKSFTTGMIVGGWLAIEGSSEGAKGKHDGKT